MASQASKYCSLDADEIIPEEYECPTTNTVSDPCATSPSTTEGKGGGVMKMQRKSWLLALLALLLIGTAILLFCRFVCQRRRKHMQTRPQQSVTPSAITTGPQVGSPTTGQTPWIATSTSAAIPPRPSLPATGPSSEGNVFIPGAPSALLPPMDSTLGSNPGPNSNPPSKGGVTSIEMGGGRDLLTDKIILIKYYRADWCPFSLHMDRTWSEVKQRLQFEKEIGLLQVNCADRADAKFGLPSITSLFTSEPDRESIILLDNDDADKICSRILGLLKLYKTSHGGGAGAEAPSPSMSSTMSPITMGAGGGSLPSSFMAGSKTLDRMYRSSLPMRLPMRG